MYRKKLKKYHIIKIILFIIFIFIIYNFFEIIISKSIAKSAANKYLYSLNIDQNEIEKFEIYFNFKRNSAAYDIIIVYKNEPNLKYRYRYIIKSNKFYLDNIFNNGTIIALDRPEEIKKPIHEKHTNIELLFLEDYDALQNENYIKYNFWDYIKDI